MMKKILSKKETKERQIFGVTDFVILGSLIFSHLM